MSTIPPPLVCGARRISSATVASLVLIGFTAVIAQVVLMREMIVVYQGNELAFGLMLASWFIWTALGSSVPGRVTAGSWNSRSTVAALQGALACVIPLSILAARFSKSWFQALPGEILGPGPMLAASLVVFSLFCFISGWLFAAGSRFYSETTAVPLGQSTSRLYLLEALGSGIGGLLSGLVLIRFFTPFEIAALLSLLNLISAACLRLSKRLHQGIAASTLLLVFAVGVFPFGARRLEHDSLGSIWKGFDLLHTRNSLHGNLAVTATEGNRSLHENGIVVATAPDPAAAEEAVHYALLMHPSPATALLIGGGVSGGITQMMQHPGITRVDYVELDPAILSIAREYFPAQSKEMDGDHRVKVHTIDGRLFVKTTASSYDVVIVNLPDPQTAQLNRFYTQEFFEEVARILSPGGVFSFRLSGAENYVSPQLASFLRCMKKTLSAAFREVAVMPGDPVHFFASTRPGTLTLDPADLTARLQARRLRTSYVREYFLPFRLAPDRVRDLELQLDSAPDVRANRDFSPVAYYFDIALWSARFAPGRSRWFQALAGVDFKALASGLAFGLIALAGLLLGFSRRERRKKAAAGFCVASMGFTLIALEILLLLAFQSLYGYVYHQLSILIAAFMAGMALGSWGGQRRKSEVGSAVAEKTDLRSLASLQALAALSPLLLTALFMLLGRLQAWTIGSQILFPALALACGCLGGCQFPMAGRIFFSRSEGPATSPGILYALDLAGSCVGALVVSLYLIPVFGFQRSAILLMILNLIPAAMAWLPSRDAA